MNYTLYQEGRPTADAVKETVLQAGRKNTQQAWQLP